jgi:hypothetical protein
VLVSSPGAILGRGSGRVRSESGERGVVAVEAAFILSVVLMPLLLGVITYGSYFWQAQRAEPLATRLPLQNIVGLFNCAELVDKVKTTVQNALPTISGLAGDELPLTAIGVKVLNVLPTIGVDVEVSISIPAVNQLGGLLPLPNGGSLVSEATYRLANVQLTTVSC